MPAFVLLEHDHPFLHWDFMLEEGASLRTWRLHSFPEPGILINAEALAHHRLAYLDYEGPVSNHRGTVKRLDRGTYTVLEKTAGRIRVCLQGERLAGVATLEQPGQEWSFRLSAGGQPEVRSEGKPNSQADQGENPGEPHVHD